MIRRRSKVSATSRRGKSSLLSLSIDPEKLKKYGLKKRQIQAASRDALYVMAANWHARYLPLHFQESAYERYTYYRRKGMRMDKLSKAYRRSYSYRKIHEKGHNNPLVFTGEGQRLSKVLNIRLSASQARVILPSKFNFKHPKSRISMRDEITRVIPEEAADLISIGRRVFRESIAKKPQGA